MSLFQDKAQNLCCGSQQDNTRPDRLRPSTSGTYETAQFPRKTGEGASKTILKNSTINKQRP